VPRVSANSQTAAVLVGILLATASPAARADEPPSTEARGDNWLVVSYPRAPGDCYRPCDLTARDDLPADQAARVASRQWTCRVFTGNGQGPNRADPADGGTSTTCRLGEEGLYDIRVRRTYTDGSTDLGGYQVEVVDRPDPPQPVSISVPQKLTTPGKVVVYSPKRMAVLTWTRGKFSFDGVLLRREAPRQSGPHAGEYAFTFLITAPRGRVRLEAKVSNRDPLTNENTVDQATARTFVTKFNGRTFQVLHKFAGTDPVYREPAAALVVLARDRVKWHARMLLQYRDGTAWKTQLHDHSRATIGGYPGAQFEPRYVLTLTDFGDERQASIDAAICGGRDYRVVAAFDIRDSHGVQLLSPKQRKATGRVEPSTPCK
jgi:hypothetical protein